MKSAILTFNTMSLLAFALFALACSGSVPALHSKGLLFAMCIAAGTFITGTVPLYYELCVDAAYPVAEGVAAGALITLNNVGCFLFLLTPRCIRV
jgi:FLVCR family MFS transporter